MRRRTAIIVIALSSCAFAAGCGGSGDSGSGKASAQNVSELYVQGAASGTISPIHGASRLFALTLRDVHPQVVWFTDRPVRDQGLMTNSAFVRDWRSNGFAADPPNAAFSLLRADDKSDTAIVELHTPRYDAKQGTITYRARILPHATGNLSGFESDNDRNIPRHFDDASLFIDNGCCQY
jgi:hypothetical protein